MSVMVHVTSFTGLAPLGVDTHDWLTAMSPIVISAGSWDCEKPLSAATPTGDTPGAPDSVVDVGALAYRYTPSFEVAVPLGDPHCLQNAIPSSVTEPHLVQ